MPNGNRFWALLGNTGGRRRAPLLCLILPLVEGIFALHLQEVGHPLLRLAIPLRAQMGPWPREGGNLINCPLRIGPNQSMWKPKEATKGNQMNRMKPKETRANPKQTKRKRKRKKRKPNQLSRIVSFSVLVSSEPSLLSLLRACGPSSGLGSGAGALSTLLMVCSILVRWQSMDGLAGGGGVGWVGGWVGGWGGGSAGGVSGGGGGAWEGGWGVGGGRWAGQLGLWQWMDGLGGGSWVREIWVGTIRRCTDPLLEDEAWVRVFV